MGFLANLFGNTVKKVAEKTIQEETKKDPSLAEKLKWADKAAEQGEKHLAKMSEKEKKEFLDEALKRVGL